MTCFYSEVGLYLGWVVAYGVSVHDDVLLRAREHLCVWVRLFLLLLVVVVFPEHAFSFKDGENGFVLTTS